MLTNLTIMYAISIQENEKMFSIVINVMIILSFLQYCMIVTSHFLVYTYHCKFSFKEKLMILFNRKKLLNYCSFDVALLNIPERTYNYTEYQGGLVSDDFNNHK